MKTLSQIIDSTTISKWISLHLLFLIFISCQTNDPKQQATNIEDTSDKQSIPLAVELINGVMSGQSTDKTQKQLEEFSFEKLTDELQSDLEKKVFWMNIYNAYVQILLQEDPELYEDRDAFFTERQIPIAKVQFSFDDIEHGILRHSKFKYGLGYINNPFSKEEVKKLQCKEVDERIHFALNCGAKSCPPIKTYTKDNFESKIEQSVRSFLKGESTYLKVENKVQTTPLFKWYSGDFEESVVDYLKRYGVLPQTANPEVTYLEYNWEISTYRNE